jgi:hypothetical protein
VGGHGLKHSLASKAAKYTYAVLTAYEFFFELTALCDVVGVGNPSFLPLLQRICDDTGDTLEAIHYKRLSPLQPSSRAIDSYRAVQRGDCVVAFSRRELYRIKSIIEKRNPTLRCCII